MNVHKIDILGRDWVKVSELTHKFQVAIALVWLVFLHLTLFEHHIGLCLEIVVIKCKVIDEMNSQKHVFFQRISQFLHKIFERKLLKIFVFIKHNLLNYFPMSAVDFILSYCYSHASDSIS